MTLSQRPIKSSTPLIQKLLESLPALDENTVGIIESYCLAPEVNEEQQLPSDLIKLGTECWDALKQEKDMEEDTSSWPPKAQGVANRLARFSEAQIQTLFKAWSEDAEDWEEKDEQHYKNQLWEDGIKAPRNVFCAPNRLLIAYYSPIASLKPADTHYKEYKLMIVREYVLSAIADTKDILIHALRIKFAMADGHHDQAMELIRKSSLKLNLKGADLSIEHGYDFRRVNLSNACLENVILSSSFIKGDNHDLRLPASVKGASLKNAEILSAYPWTNDNKAFIKVFFQAEGGLDIRFKNPGGTVSFLHYLSEQNNHIYPDRFHEIQSFLQHGAAVKRLDDEGNLPCSHAMITYNNFYYYTFTDAVNYSQLIANLNEKELEEQDELCQKRRNRIWLYIGLYICMLFAIAACCAWSLLTSDNMEPIAQIAASHPGLFAAIGLISYLGTGFGFLTSVLANMLIIPDALYSTFTDYYEIRKAIEWQRLANNPGPKQKDYQFHLLFKKKYLSQNVDIPANGVPNTNDYFTPPEKVLFVSLNNREQLQSQRKLNKELASKDRLDAVRIFLIGLIFIGVAALAVLAVIYSPLCSLPPAKTCLSQFYSLSAFDIFPMIFNLLHSFRFFYRAVTKWRESNKIENAIEQMIQEKIDALPASTAELGLAPASELKLESTRSPMPTPAVEPEDKVKVESASATGIGLYPVSPRIRTTRDLTNTFQGDTLTPTSLPTKNATQLTKGPLSLSRA